MAEKGLSSEERGMHLDMGCYTFTFSGQSHVEGLLQCPGALLDDWQRDASRKLGEMGRSEESGCA